MTDPARIKTTLVPVNAKPDKPTWSAPPSDNAPPIVNTGPPPVALSCNVLPAKVRAPGIVRPSGMAATPVTVSTPLVTSPPPENPDTVSE